MDLGFPRVVLEYAPVPGLTSGASNVNLASAIAGHALFTLPIVYVLVFHRSGLLFFFAFVGSDPVSPSFAEHIASSGVGVATSLHSWRAGFPGSPGSPADSGSMIVLLLSIQTAFAL